MIRSIPSYLQLYIVHYGTISITTHVSCVCYAFLYTIVPLYKNAQRKHVYKLLTFLIHRLTMHIYNIYNVIMRI